MHGTEARTSEDAQLSPLLWHSLLDWRWTKSGGVYLPKGYTVLAWALKSGTGTGTGTWH